MASLVFGAVGPQVFAPGEEGGAGVETAVGVGQLEQDLRDRLARNPEDAVAAASLANVLLLDGRTSEAVDLHERAVSLDPENIQYRRDFAATLVELGRYADAEVQYRRALAIDDGDGQARLGLARVLEETADDPAAVAEYQRLIADQPGTFYAEEAQRALGRLAGAGRATPAASPVTPPARG